MGIPASSAWALAIKDVRLGQTSSRETRLVIDLDGRASFKAFVLDSPYRMVVDLPAVAWKALPSSRRKDNLLITGYRSGKLDDGSTRIVFDARAPFEMSGPVLLPPSDGGLGWRLVFDFRPATRENFLAARGKLFSAPDAQAPSKTSVSSRAEASLLPVKKPAVLSSSASALSPVHSRKRTIIIDAGHGGEDPGAMSDDRIVEKNITLAAAKVLKSQLEATGNYKVVLTRSGDIYIPLRRRVEIARENKADLFISLHADKIGRRGVQGASIYTLSEKASDDETALLAENANTSGVVAGVDLASQTEEVADILVDLAMRDKMNQSNYFAEMLVRRFGEDSIRMVSNSHRSAGFAVLKAPDVPAVLVEIGFLSNPREARLLNSAFFQGKLAAALVKGVDSYFRKIDSLQKT